MLTDSSLQSAPSVIGKILPFHAASARLRELREAGKRIVQCHGTFDLIHPGHIYHLEEARALGDVLVVTVTSEPYVNKGPGRPYFNDELRAKCLSALECVDYVILVPYPAAVEAIECVRPDIYCKGTEYREARSDVTGNIHDDVASVERLGGMVRYIGSVVFSSTKLLNNHFDHLGGPVKEFARTLAAEHSSDDLRRAVESFADMRVLVLGDTIFDRYSYLNVQGLASKNRIISGRFLREDSQCGGALAVFRHLREFTPHGRFISLVGTEPWVEAALSDHVPPGSDLIVRDPTFTTIIKQRFVEPLSDGKELSKLFSVNFIDADPPSESALDRLLTRVDEVIDEVDAVFLLDFGHGMMQSGVRDLVQERAPFLALNCQTNSNNHGFNIISRQYRRADSFSLDAQELQLACGHRHIDFANELEALRGHLDARYAWLTRGAIETIGLRRGDEPCLCPPLENDVVDTVGAGDAFFTLASMAAVRELPIELGTFLGQLAGAQAVRIVGNSSSISRAKLLKSGMSLINF
jgi:rfaE bifunctional protein nucleotidyltransferase chain/domain